MKAVILSAGKGTRLKPITDSIPKVMVEINGKPLLQYHIEWLTGNGVKDIGINLHHQPNVIRDYFGNGENFGANSCYSFEPEILGTSGGFKNFEEFIVNEQCIIVYGDNLFEIDFNDFKYFHQNRDAMVTICVREWEDPTSKGIVEVSEESRILVFKENPGPEDINSKIGNAGIYLVEPTIFSYIKKNVYSDFGKDIFPNMIAADERLFAYNLKGYHEDIGTIDMLTKVRQDVGKYDNLA